MKKTAILVAMTVVLGAASAGGAFARSHDRTAAERAAQSTTTNDETLGYANNRYRAPVGANPYTHDLPSTDGSDR